MTIHEHEVIVPQQQVMRCRDEMATAIARGSEIDESSDDSELCLPDDSELCYSYDRRLEIHESSDDGELCVAIWTTAMCTHGLRIGITKRASHMMLRIVTKTQDIQGAVVRRLVSSSTSCPWR